MIVWSSTVRIKPTSDDEIDVYVGQVGVVQRVEKEGYLVRMPDGQTIFVNDLEVEQVE